MDRIDTQSASYNRCNNPAKSKTSTWKIEGLIQEEYCWGISAEDAMSETGIWIGIRRLGLTPATHRKSKVMVVIPKRIKE